MQEVTQNALDCTQAPTRCLAIAEAQKAQEGALQELAALRAKLDDAKGKRCECGGPLVALRSVDLRICNDCKTETPWRLSEGQKPLIGSNRSDRK